MSEIKPIPIENPDWIEIRKRKRYPFYDMISILIQGEEFFMEVDRKSAHYIKRKLNNILNAVGYMVDATPTTYKDDNGNILEGYLFRLVEVGGEIVLVDKSRFKEELKKRVEKLIKDAEGQIKVIESQPLDRSLTGIKKQLKTRIETLKEVLRIIENL